MKTELSIEDIAKICHQANKNYCELLGDDSHYDWGLAPGWQKLSAINGVKAHVDSGLTLNGEDSHIAWMKEKTKEGWIYGEAKDPVKKLHPCMVDYHELPKFQKVKDALFTSIIRALGTHLVKGPFKASEVSHEISK